MSFSAILIANRGEIAIRIIRAAADLGIRTVAIYTEDDADSLHTRVADEAQLIPGVGARGYLDTDAVVQAAQAGECDAVHPGYGFLAEQADFAEQCIDAGLKFVGPRTEHLALFGDKGRARAAATASNVPVPRGVDNSVSLDAAIEFYESLGRDGAMIIKAVAGGGGRGTRVVLMREELKEAYERCRSEAQLSFGLPDVYVEEFIPLARHIEVQIVGDGHGAVTHLYERECSVQRRYQKLVEIAPAPHLDRALRESIIESAVRFASEQNYMSLGTFEFLVDVSGRENAQPFVFIEANARLQVEHTVTEEVTGVDLVQSQIRLADGATLCELGLDQPSRLAPRGYAIQARVNMETISADGSVKPTGGLINVYEAPSGPGVRTDGFGYAGYTTSTAFDSLLAKVICHSPSVDFDQAIVRTKRALSEFRIDGIGTNIPFVINILSHTDFENGAVHTRWTDENIIGLAAFPADNKQRFATTGNKGLAASSDHSNRSDGFAGAKVDTNDPLALFSHDARMKAGQETAVPEDAVLFPAGPAGSVAIGAPMQGTIVHIDVQAGDEVAQGQQLAVVEAMKMEHVIHAPLAGIVREVTMAAGDIVKEGYPIIYVEEAEVDGSAVKIEQAMDLDHIRDDLQELYDRRALTLDENREEAVARRKERGYRMARENIAELLDADSFSEYWPLIVAEQHERYDIETLRKNTPADGVIAGTGTINAALFGEEASRAIIAHYDYTVLAGTQGGRNHYKLDRMFELANRFRMPLVLFGEGGGGRPGEDRLGNGVAFDVPTYNEMSKLSGLVPLVAVTNGRCFAGNTALVAACDVIIATEGSTLAMGGPAMIEGGGLGIYTPEEVGPMSFQVPNGVVDILVKDEAEAVQVAKKYLSYFQGSLDDWESNDQRSMRHVVPENRLRLYDMRELIATLADKDSVLEIREKFGVGLITSFVRVEGQAMGVIANNPHHLSGALDSDASDKGARFMQLCDAFDIPIISLIDCPGIMVGPDVERTALVRRSARMFNTGANLTTPFFCVLVRKAYGLGVQAMCGANAHAGLFTVAWPTAEFAAMNIEGAVKLGFRRELESEQDPEERLRLFQERVDSAYEEAKAINAIVHGGIDDVIDPADTRKWIAKSMKRLPPREPRTGKKYPYVDTW